MLGTLIGAGIVWFIVLDDPNPWLIISAIAFLQFATEVVIGYNYALGQVVITPMALLMVFLAAPPGTADTTLAAERVIDTVIGASLGLILGALAANVDARRKEIRRRRHS